MIDEKTIPLEAITAAEVELARVLKGFDYCMPADGMQRVLTAALSALRPGSTGETEGWQPIETAPKDWSDVLLFVPGYTDEREVCEGFFDKNAERWRDSRNQRVAPTAWRPLPSPPSAMLAAAGGR